MRSRLFIVISLVVIAAVVLVIGVAVAGAGQSSPLPTVTAPELLAKMAQANDVTAVSGDISWHNGLFGDLSQAAGMAHLPAQSPLTSSGSGRIWVGDAGTRVESQGGGGDQVVVVNKAERTAWVYDYAANTVKKVVVTGSAPAETQSPAPSAATMLTPEAIALYLQRLSAFATVEVAGQTKVAGRDTYQLRFTPTATDTALGYVQAAIDGQTMLPLQLEVYAKGGTTPVIKFGFTSVSYDPIDAATFTFTPPAGAKVTTKTINADQVHAKLAQAKKQHKGKQPTAAQRAKAMQAVQGALLTRGQVAKLVPYQLAYARDYTARPYQWGYVLGQKGPLTGSGAPLLKALAGATGMDLSGMMGMPSRSQAPGSHARAGATTMSPASVLLYGKSLGTIALAQTKTTADLQKQLKQAQQASQILGSTTINGAKAVEVGTPLGGIILWQQGNTTLVAGGMVPMSDLEAFASSVR